MAVTLSIDDTKIVLNDGLDLDEDNKADTIEESIVIDGGTIT